MFRSRKYTISLLLVLFAFLLPVQAGDVYHFLNLPVSSRQAALGGKNVSLYDKDLNFSFQNPALLNSSNDHVISLNTASLLADIHYSTAIYGWKSTVGSWGVGMTYLDYGAMNAYDEYDQSQGEFSAKDMALSIIYSRPLAEHLQIGAAFKPVFSYFEQYTSYGLGVDLGLSYQLPEKGFSAGLSVRNIGTQLKDYSSDQLVQGISTLPLDVELGLSKQLNHAPFRLSVTLHQLQNWKMGYVNNSNGLLDYDVNDYMVTIKPVDLIFRHAVFGLEFLLGKNLYLATSYDHKMHQELKLAAFKSMSGFAFGGGLRLKMIQLGFSASQYQLGNIAYQFSISTSLDEFKF